MRTTGAWLRGLVFVGALTAMAVGARAADIATEVGELAAAVDARLGGGAEGKEAKKLKTATKKLAKLTGKEIQAKDLRKVLTAVYVSKTTDATVLAEAQDVLDCLRGLVVGQRTTVEGILVELIEKYRDKLTKKINSAQIKLDAADALVASDPKKAGKLLHVAYVKFQKASRVGQRFLELMNKVASKVEISGTLTGEGFRETFRAWASSEVIFGQIQVWGCSGASGNNPACKETLAIDFFYPEGSRQTGPATVMEVSYTASSNYTGGGVQDLFWSSTAATLTIVESSAKWIKGRFTATLESFDTEPHTLEVAGTFAIKR